MADSNIGVFLKPLLILALILGIFSWIFIQSQTLEMVPVMETRNGLPYKVTHYKFHWDRFKDYVSNTPTRISEFFSKKK